MYNIEIYKSYVHQYLNTICIWTGAKLCLPLYACKSYHKKFFTIAISLIFELIMIDSGLMAIENNDEYVVIIVNNPIRIFLNMFMRLYSSIRHRRIRKFRRNNPY